jgi:hypothetical protein
VSLEDQGEVGELKRKFGDKIPFLREICPGWSDEDLVFALEETKGDVEAAVDRISSGMFDKPDSFAESIWLTRYQVQSHNGVRSRRSNPKRKMQLSLAMEAPLEVVVAVDSRLEAVDEAPNAVGVADEVLELPPKPTVPSKSQKRTIGR